MTSGIAGFGGNGYSSPQQRTLSSIADTPDADTSSQEDLVRLLQQHDRKIKFLAANQKQLQQGVNDATANPLQQIQQFIADVIVLLGGGQLAEGLLDFGDLQYILPALGALLGIDGDTPFPVNLFHAAEKFFLGYVVPNAQFADVINKIIEEWAKVFGIDADFIRDVKALITAFGDLFDGLQNLLPSLNELFGALGITGGDLGPLGQALAPIIKLFSGIDLENFGDAIEFITDAISPFIESLTAIINFVNSILAVFGYDGGSVVNSPIGDTTLPFANLLSFLADINFGSPDFNPIAAAATFITNVLSPTGLLAAVDFVRELVQSVVDLIVNALTGSNHSGHPIELLQTVLSNVANGISTALTAANEAANVARQFGQYVIQIVQSLEETPVIGDFVELVNAFAFWVLGWFGITQQSVTDTNPAVAALGGRVGALEAINTPGFEGFHDHFNRPAIGPDWVTITPYNPLNIHNSEALKSYNHCAGRYDAANLLTDNWHVQWSLAYPDYGQSRIYVSTNGNTAESSFTNGLAVDINYTNFGFGVGEGFILTVYTMSGGLISGLTQRRQYNFGDHVVKIGDVFAIEYYEADDTFYFFRNNIEVPNLRWADGAGIVQHGAGHREIAILTNLANNASFSGPGFDDMSVYDIKVT